MFSLPLELCLLLVAGFVQLTSAQDFWPAAVPLAVKTPYLNSWLQMGVMDGPSNLYRWPQHWTLAHTLGQLGFLRVDGLVYVWLGNAPNYLTANLTGLSLTPTSTKFSLQAVGMDMNVTFLSPIEPDDMARQSFPFTYIYVDLASNDGQAHDVQVYLDISGEWISQDSGMAMTYDTSAPSDSSQIVYHYAQRAQPAPLTDNNGTAEDATVYLGMKYDSSVTYGIANDTQSRSWFDHNKTLNNTKASTQNAINDNYPVFALAKDLGSMQSLSDPIVFALGLSRDPVTQIKVSGNLELRYPYYKTKYDQVADGIADFLADFDNARSRANTLDDKILSSARDVSSNMADLVSLTLRSVMASMEITYGSDASDIMIFVKGMGSHDSEGARRVNPVEELYAAWPAIMNLNATYGRYILEPLLKYQSGAGISYAAPDLGNTYPDISGGTPDNGYAIEQTGNMLLMTWAQARFSGDTHITTTYYTLLKSWADYLETRVLTPTGFKSGDGLEQNNQTNLALKGILGIRAMSELARIQGDNSAADSYSSTAGSLISQWQSLAVSSGHLTSEYGKDDTWALMYNLYPDRWLGLNLVDQSVYDGQTSQYAQLGNGAPYGLGYASEASSDAKSQWTLFTAATTTNNQTRDALISGVRSRAGNNRTLGVFPASYDAQTGASYGGEASSSLGGLFAPMSLHLPIQIQSGAGKATDSSSSSKSNAGAIAGGVVGGVALIALIVLAIFFWRRKQKKQREDEENEKHFMPNEAHGVAPYDYAPVVPSHGSDFVQSNGAGVPVGAMPPNTHSQSYGNSEHSSTYGYQQHSPGAFTTPQAPPLPRKGGQPPATQVQNTPTHPASSSSGPASSHNPPTESGAGSDLRNEVEQLRREMEAIRAAGGTYEPPPQYS